MKAPPERQPGHGAVVCAGVSRIGASASVPPTEGDATSHAGATPETMHATNARTPATPSTRQSVWTGSGNRPDTYRSSPCVESHATAMAHAASSADSRASNRTMRPLVAPSERRTDSSRVRSSDRASCRLATLAQPMMRSASGPASIIPSAAAMSAEFWIPWPSGVAIGARSL